MKKFLWKLYTLLFASQNIKPIEPPKPDHPDEETIIEPSWIWSAKKELGVREFISGKNPKIQEYHAAAGNPQWDQDVSWCSSFMCYIMKKAGYLIPRSKPSLARSWLTTQGYKKLDEPKYGCIVVYDNPDTSSKSDGHVGFYISHTDKNVLTLGGNQSNQVCYKEYKKQNVLGYLWPI